MKKTFVLLLMLAWGITAGAYDFVVDGFAYSILSGQSSVELMPNKYYKDHLTTIRIPSHVTHNGKTYSVTSIYDYAFADCSEATSIEFPQTLTTINTGAFHNCTSLTSVTIPSGITNIGNDIFEGCVNLKTLNYNAVKVIRSSLYADSMCGWENCKIENINIGSGVQILPIGFAAYQAIKSISIPSSVKTIAREAFRSCENLTSISIPSSVTTIGTAAFCWSGLTSVSIPKTIKNWDGLVFANCKKLERVTIQSSGTIIGKSCFKGCENLKNVINSDNIFRIRESAFEGCTSLSIISLSRVDSIGKRAFQDCSSLSQVTLGNTLNVIGEAAFSGIAISEITIPKSVKSIGGGAFSQCNALKKVYFNAIRCLTENSIIQNSPVEHLFFGEDVEYIGVQLAENSKNLKEITIPAKVSYIDIGAFYGCTSAKKISIMSQQELALTSHTFKNCSSVERIDFPKAEVGKNSPLNSTQDFDGLTSLREIYCQRAHPYLVGFDGNSFFGESDKTNVVVHVPKGCIENYHVQPESNRPDSRFGTSYYNWWVTFNNYRDDLENSAISTIHDDEVQVSARDGEIVVLGMVSTMIEIYDLSGHLVYSGTARAISITLPGIYLIRVNGQTLKVKL